MLQESKAAPSAKNSPALKPAKEPASFAPESVNIRVTIEKFGALESGETSTVAMKMEAPSSIVSLASLPQNQIKVAPWNPATEAQAVKIRFRMDRTGHLLLGIAFSHRRLSSASKNTTVGSEEFPSTVIENDGNDRAMTVTHLRSTEAASYDFQILAQKIETGELTLVREARKDKH